MTQHHPGEEQLAAYAAGSLGEAPALLLATHLALCPACRGRVGEYEALGGALLDALEPAELAADSLERTLARLAQAEQPALASPPPTGRAAGRPRFPEPLRSYVGDPQRLAWRRRLLPGLRFAALPAVGADAWLLRVAAGRAIPRHRHGGQEMVLVLEGGYHDGAVAYGPGDVQTSGPEIDHRPVADPEAECLCLVVVEGGFRPGGWLGRLTALLGC